MKMAALSPNVDLSTMKLTEKQKGIVELLEMTGGTSVKEICYFTGTSTSVIDTLRKKGVIYFYDEEVFRIESRTAESKPEEIIL